MRRNPPFRRGPRRYSPFRPYRGRGGRASGGGGAAAASSFLRRDSRTPSPARVRSPPQRPPPASAKSPRTPPSAPMPSLNERFENLLEVTLRRHRRDYGVLGGLAHLVLTNRLKLPLPTLMREAKELSVVIERNLPSGKSTNFIHR